jgi:hypothetical protein
MPFPAPLQQQAAARRRWGGERAAASQICPYAGGPAGAHPPSPSASLLGLLPTSQVKGLGKDAKACPRCCSTWPRSWCRTRASCCLALQAAAKANPVHQFLLTKDLFRCAGRHWGARRSRGKGEGGRARGAARGARGAAHGRWLAAGAYARACARAALQRPCPPPTLPPSPTLTLALNPCLSLTSTPSRHTSRAWRTVPLRRCGLATRASASPSCRARWQA